MKSLIAVLLLALTLISVSSAELLVTADPLGQGKWGVLGAGLQNSSYGGSGSTATLTSFGGYVGYGINDKLDAFVNLASANVSVGGGTVTIGGATLKYTLWSEGKDLPVSVSLGAGYRAMTINPGSLAGTQILAGVGVSKVMVPFVPYGGLTYRSSTLSGAAFSTQLDLTVGTAIAWSQQGAVFVEDTMQSITPNAGSSYTSNQIGLGVGYKI